MRLLMLIAYSDSSVIIATVNTLPLTAKFISFLCGLTNTDFQK